MTRLNGKVAVVTGATSGIGKEAAKLMALNGAKVAICGRREAEGEAVVRGIVEAGGEAIFIRADVTEEASVQNLVSIASSTFGGIDILYNNAGGSTSADGSVVDAPIEEFWRAIKLDLFGTWLCSRHVVPEMRTRGSGSIINSGSIVGLMGMKNRSAYTASKGGVMALTRAMAVEFAPDRIRVNAVAPGAVLTERINGFIEKEPAIAATLSGYPLGPACPEDVANAVVFLASDESARISGQILPIEGGLLIS